MFGARKSPGGAEKIGFYVFWRRLSLTFDDLCAWKNAR
jgi:hypothetical protein